MHLKLIILSLKELHRNAKMIIRISYMLVMSVIEKMQQFEEKMKELSEEEARSYIEISVTLRTLQNLLFENKE